MTQSFGPFGLRHWATAITVVFGISVTPVFGVVPGAEIDRGKFARLHERLDALRAAFHDPDRTAAELNDYAENVQSEVARVGRLTNNETEIEYLRFALEANRNAWTLAQELNEPSSLDEDPQRRRSRDILAALILTIEDRLSAAEAVWRDQSVSPIHERRIEALSKDAESDDPKPSATVPVATSDNVEARCVREGEIYVWGTVGPEKFFASDRDRDDFARFLARIENADLLAIETRGADMVVGVTFCCPQSGQRTPGEPSPSRVVAALRESRSAIPAAAHDENYAPLFVAAFLGAAFFFPCIPLGSSAALT